MMRVVVIVVLPLVALAIVFHDHIAPPEKNPPEITIGEYGVVQSVGPCRQSKHSYYCRVETDLATFSDMKVSQFPGSHMETNERIFLQTKDYGTRREAWLCRNDLCSHSSTCYWWMPCLK